MKKKIISAVLCGIMLANIPSVLAENEYVTRGEVADMLLIAADDYNPDVLKTDIIMGYDDGELHEDWSVTRAEALVMLKRAFGELPEPVGYNAMVALPSESFSDIPDWAKTELSDVFDAGIAAGTSEGVFSPDDNVTKTQMELFIERVYSLFGTNLKDDFYAAVNKDALNSLEIKPGRVMSGTLYDLQDKSTEDVNVILSEIIGGTYEKGTKEQKIADFYQSVADMDSRNKEGIAPIKAYLEKIDSAENIDDLINIQSTFSKELFVFPFMGFNLTVDLKDSNSYMLTFSTFSPSLPKDTYFNGTEQQINAYLEYIKTLYMLGGETEENAEKMANMYFELEKLMAKSMLDTADSGNVDKIYNIYTMDEIKAMFPDVDMDVVFADSGFKEEDKIIIFDTGLAKAYAEYFRNENIDTLKACAKLSLLKGWGGAFNQGFIDASDQFNQEFMGVSGSYTPEERALLTVQNIMPDYIGEFYAQRYFTEEAKKDVEKMVGDIITVYRKRIENLSWMSDETKEKALKKLDTMKVKIGYPDNWETSIDNAEIKSTADGGSYFTNMLSILAAQREENIDLQGTAVDKTQWIMYPFTVNACYSATQNDITFPAAILQAPMYDVNASYEQNLGGIGYIIAHEITHAFDNNGAKFDENGNASDWWTEEDYEAFNILCDKMVEFYDGEEGVPGIPMSGTLTLSENVADNGAAACVTEIVAGLEDPDFETLYKSMANCWASMASREYCQYAAQADVHSADKLRVNRVVVNCDEFFDTFDIGEGDGMWVAPEDRVKIW